MNRIPQVASSPLKKVLSEHEIRLGSDRWKLVRTEDGLYRELGAIRQKLHHEPLLPLGFSAGTTGANQRWLFLDRGEGRPYRLRYPLARRPPWAAWQQWSALKPMLEAWLNQYPPGVWSPDTPN